MIKIIHTPTPVFELDGVQHYVNSERFRTFAQLEQKLVLAEEKGFTKCYLYTLYTQHDRNFETVMIDNKPEMKYLDGENVTIWVRWKFIKD